MSVSDDDDPHRDLLAAVASTWTLTVTDSYCYATCAAVTTHILNTKHRRVARRDNRLYLRSGI